MLSRFHHLTVALFVTAVLTLGLTATASAETTWYVDDDAAPGGDGTSWPTAFKHPQDALAAASAGDEIRVAQGIYQPDRDADHPDGTADREATFQLIDSVALYGGYRGLSGGGDPDDRDIDLFETILSGDLLGNDGPDFANNQENSIHVVTASGTGETTVLDGLTISGGHAWGWYHDKFGAGMCNEGEGGAGLTVTSCTFRGNMAADRGAGLFNDRSSPTLVNCAFEGNAAWYGGGMCNESSSNPTITDCSFTGNQADLSGGAVYNDHSDPTLINCVFADNASQQMGGGVYNIRSDPMLNGCTFSGNTAVYFGGGMFSTSYSVASVTGCTFICNAAHSGGGMYNDFCGSPIVTDCEFRENTADYAGGGIGNNNHSSPTVIGCSFTGNVAECGGGLSSSDDCIPAITGCMFDGNAATARGGGMWNTWDSNAIVTRCTFRRNTAELRGGGVGNGDSDVFVTNCTFYENDAGKGGAMSSKYECSPTATNCVLIGNTADYGGALYNWNGAVPTVTNCTVSGNSARGGVGGIYNDLSSACVTNCILWGNSDSEGTGESAQICGGSPDVNYCCVQGWTGSLGGAGNIDADPLFVDPDGPDDDPNTWEDADYHLLPGSPCIDAGCNWAVPSDRADLDDDGNTTEITPLDFDGEGRFFDERSTPDTGCGCPPIVDMGVYESGGNGSPPCPGDLDGDREVGHSDLGILLSAWQSSSEGDLNCDGVTDQGDLGILLSRWGETCP